MVIIGRSQIAGGGGVAPDIDFEYSGQYIRRAEDNVVEFLTTGVLTIKKDVYTDLFLVGGGGGGTRSGSGSYLYNGGGGGGYTKTVSNVLLRKGTYDITIGAGGTGATGSNATDGGTTSITGFDGLFDSIGGGKHGDWSSKNGVAGGCGSGGACFVSTAKQYSGGNGGSDGSNGSSTIAGYIGGTGQGTTTREFGESTGKLYAGGGGGGGAYDSGYNADPGYGGVGGGGGGRTMYASGQSKYGEVDGTPNSGGGGGGGFYDNRGDSYGTYTPGNGGSGIICMRVHKE